jgi:centromeric protein E
MSQPFKLGDDVFVGESGLPAKVRYIGKTKFARGIWVGVELSRREDKGKNSGVVKGERYFSCRHDKGLFLKPASIKISKITDGNDGDSDSSVKKMKAKKSLTIAEKKKIVEERKRKKRAHDAEVLKKAQEEQMAKIKAKMKEDLKKKQEMLESRKKKKKLTSAKSTDGSIKSTKTTKSTKPVKTTTNLGKITGTTKTSKTTKATKATKTTKTTKTTDKLPTAGRKRQRTDISKQHALSSEVTVDSSSSSSPPGVAILGKDILRTRKSGIEARDEIDKLLKKTEVAEDTDDMNVTHIEGGVSGSDAILDNRDDVKEEEGNGESLSRKNTLLTAQFTPLLPSTNSATQGVDEGHDGGSEAELVEEERRIPTRRTMNRRGTMNAAILVPLVGNNITNTIGGEETNNLTETNVYHDGGGDSDVDVDDDVQTVTMSNIHDALDIGVMSAPQPRPVLSPTFSSESLNLKDEHSITNDFTPLPPTTPQPATSSSSSSPSKIANISSTASLSPKKDAGRGKEERVSVGIRIRPLSQEQKQKGIVEAWYSNNDKSMVSATPEAHANNEKKRQSLENRPLDYIFDHIWGGLSTTNDTKPQPTESNATIHNDVCESLINAVFEGYNSTIFAYGQTATGKTHTITGTFEDPGLLPRSVTSIFQTIKNSDERDYLVRCSYIEVYNEQIDDLLNPNKKDLKIFESKDAGTTVPDLTEITVSTSEEVLNLIERGVANQHIGATLMNLRSSRAHSFFRIVIESRAVETDTKNKKNAIKKKKFKRAETALGPREHWKQVQMEVRTPNKSMKKNAKGFYSFLSTNSNKSHKGKGDVTVANFNIVDLAGSERARKTGAKGVRLKEGSSINKSLLTLSRVIQELSKGKKRNFIPFRNSKLTRLLAPSLGGNARTCVICCVSPLASNFEESDSTLRFASTCKKVVNRVIKNEIRSKDALITQYESMIQDLQVRLQKVSMKKSDAIMMSRNASAPTILPKKESSASVALASPGIKAWLSEEGGHTPDEIVDRLAIESARNKKAHDELESLKNMILGATRKSERDPSKGSDLIRMMATRLEGENLQETLAALSKDESDENEKYFKTRRPSIQFDEVATLQEKESMKRIHHHTRSMSLLVVEDHEHDADSDESKCVNEDSSGHADDLKESRKRRKEPRRDTVNMASQLPFEDLSSTNNHPEDSIKISELQNQILLLNNNIKNEKEKSMAKEKELHKELQRKHEEEVKSLQAQLKNATSNEVSESNAGNEYKKKYFLAQMKLAAAKEYDERLQIELTDRENKLREVSSALKMTLIQARTAMRQQESLEEAVNAQEKSHLKAIQLLHERHTQSIAEAAEKEKQLQLKLNETADISRVELLNLKEEMIKKNEKVALIERESSLSKNIIDEQKSELAELKLHIEKLEEQRTLKGDELKDLHVRHINETSKLESSLSILRSELSTSQTDAIKKIERLEQSLLSSENSLKDYKEKHKNDISLIETKLKNEASENLNNVKLKLNNDIDRLTRNHKMKIEHIELDHKNQLETLSTKLDVEIASHRESSKNADIALSRLRETLDLERDIQVTSINDEKQQMERLYKQKLNSEIEKHQDVHSTLRFQLNEMNETTTELKAKLRMAERERASQLRLKDEELLRALENSRLEHQEAHKSTVMHYENTIEELQSRLVLTRAKLSDLEAKHAKNVEIVVADRNKVASEIEADQKSSLKMLSLGLEKEASKVTQARMSEQRYRSELNEKNRELENISYTHQTAQRDLSERFQQQMQVCLKKTNDFCGKLIVLFFF